MRFFRAPLINKLKPRLIAISICLLLVACLPTPMKINDAIGRGQIDDAIQKLSKLLNHGGGEMSSRKLQSTLQALSVSRHFDLDRADNLFDQLQLDGKRVILRWYINQYLEASEAALKEQDPLGKQFDHARRIWERQQKMRGISFPEFREATPVLGVISLREADYWASRGDMGRARQAFQRAKKELTTKQAFDRVQQYSFNLLVDEVKKKIK